MAIRLFRGSNAVTCFLFLGLLIGFSPLTQAAIFDIKIDGSDAIFLAGRTDLTIPPASEPWPGGLIRHSRTPEEIKETLPPIIRVSSGQVIRALDPAKGEISFYNGFGVRPYGPNGGAGGQTNLSSFGGISGFLSNGLGPLVGVFLDDNIPNGTAPTILNFTSGGLGTEFLSITPGLNQVFFIGDGVTSGGEFQQFIAPNGATRLALGIVDGFSFRGSPGAYDDNDGAYYIRIGIDEIPSIKDEIIGTWDSGIWYRNVAASSWKKMYSGVPSGDIAAGDFTGDGKADVASIWSSGLYYQNGANLSWTKVTSTAPYELTAGDVTGDGRAEIIGTWPSGIWYRNVAASSWKKMYSGVPFGDIAAGDFTGDGKADVASIWSSGLYYQNGANLSWTKVTSTAPYTVTAGDVTGDGRSEIIGIWPSGIFYRNVAASSWKKMYSGVPSGDIAAGDFTGDGKADVASIWSSGLYYQNGANLSWTKVTSTAPYTVTAGDVTGN